MDALCLGHGTEG